LVYYFRVVAAMYFRRPEYEAPAIRSTATDVAIAAALAGTVLLGVLPGWWHDAIRGAQTVLGFRPGAWAPPSLDRAGAPRGAPVPLRARVQAAGRPSTPGLRTRPRSRSEGPPEPQVGTLRRQQPGAAPA